MRFPPSFAATADNLALPSASSRLAEYEAASATAEFRESIADLADDYGEDPLNIEEAVGCELQPAKAA